MPIYEYECAQCGTFTALRPMAEYLDPSVCPDCGDAAPRVLLSAPNIGGMDPARRRAHGKNEQSAHAPARSGGHGANCGCAVHGGRRASPAAAAPAAKSFPQKRPWMISH